MSAAVLMNTNGGDCLGYFLPATDDQADCGAVEQSCTRHKSNDDCKSDQQHTTWSPPDLFAFAHKNEINVSRQKAQKLLSSLSQLVFYNPRTNIL